MGYINIGFEVINCGVEGCNIPFGLERGTVDARRIDGRKFWCPNGHHINFKPDRADPVKKVRAELDSCRMEGQRAAAQAKREASLRRKAEKRLKAARDGHAFYDIDKWRGLCPDCYAEQPRGSKKRSLARRWARQHCAVPVQPQANVDSERKVAGQRDA